MLREEYIKRLTDEYSYAVTKMQEAEALDKKLFYFSVFFGEAQRVINWEWDANLALIYLVTNHVHTQINGVIQSRPMLPINWVDVTDKLILLANNLASYISKINDNSNINELYKILTGLAEVSYSVSGNGSYLCEKGAFKL